MTLKGIPIRVSSFLEKEGFVDQRVWCLKWHCIPWRKTIQVRTLLFTRLCGTLLTHPDNVAELKEAMQKGKLDGKQKKALVGIGPFDMDTHGWGNGEIYKCYRKKIFTSVYPFE